MRYFEEQPDDFVEGSDEDRTQTCDEPNPVARFDVLHKEQVWFSPLMPLVGKAWDFLLKSTYDDGQCPVDHRCSAFYAQVGEEIIGFLAYQKIDWKNEIWIALGYVTLEHRGKGV